MKVKQANVDNFNAEVVLVTERRQAVFNSHCKRVAVNFKNLLDGFGSGHFHQRAIAVRFNGVFGVLARKDVFHKPFFVFSNFIDNHRVDDNRFMPGAQQEFKFLAVRFRP